MKCLQCGSDTRVTTTYQNVDLTTKRRRECLVEKCGFRFTTREKPETGERPELDERERRVRDSED